MLRSTSPLHLASMAHTRRRMDDDERDPFQSHIQRRPAGVPMATPVSGTHPRCKFAGNKAVTWDVHTAAAWPRPSPAIDAGTTVNDGMFLPRNSAPRKRLKINALRFAQK